MKKISIILVTVLSLFLGCEPLEVKIKDAFSFDIEANSENTSFLETPISTDVLVTPEREVTDVKYYFSYAIRSGQGYYKNSDNEILSEEQEYEMENFNILLNYFGINSGNHVIEITIRDSNDLIKSHILTYHILEKTDFIFQLTTDDESLYLGESLNYFVNLTTLENELEEDISYTYSLTQSNSSGACLFNSETIDLLQMLEITPGNYQGTFTANEYGDIELVFTIEASNGITHSQTLQFEVLQTDFNFTVIPEETSDYVRDKTIFHFNIEKEGVENLTYTMQFSGQNGVFNINGINYTSGQQINVPEGFFEMVYQANEITNEDITIIISASNGITKTLDVEYESLATEFDIVITPGTFNSYYSFNNAYFEVNIIAPPVDDYFLEYTMHFETTIPNNTINLNFQNAQIQELSNNIFSFGSVLYSGGNFSLLGSIQPTEGTITFYFTDSNGIIRSKTVNVSWWDY